MLIRYKTKEISVNNGGFQSYSALISKNKSPFMNKLAGFRLGNFLWNLFQRLVYAWKCSSPKRGATKRNVFRLYRSSRSKRSKHTCII